jgi:hypothetical protein
VVGGFVGCVKDKFGRRLEAKRLLIAYYKLNKPVNCLPELLEAGLATLLWVGLLATQKR